MRGVDLFSGIGLFSLGMEEAGIETVAACELADWKRLIHEELCGEMPMWHDIRDIRGSEVIERAGPIDIVFGSPPCTDASLANSNGKGVAGAETGLFLEAVRVIREIRPDWIALENVPGLRTRGADWVLTELEEAGYAVWPFVVGADNLGAPHIRKRVWIVGYHADADSNRGNRQARRVGMGGEHGPAGEVEDLGAGANPDSPGTRQQPRRSSGQNGQGAAVVAAENDPNPHGQRRQHDRGRGQRGDVSFAEAVHDGTEATREQVGRGGQPRPIYAAHDQINGRRAGRQGRLGAGGEGQSEQALQAVAFTEKQSGRGVDTATRYWTELAGAHGHNLAALEQDIGPAIHDWAGGLGRYLRVADGCPAKTARMLMSACGDGVVVSVGAAIGRAIRQADQMT